MIEHELRQQITSLEEFVSYPFNENYRPMVKKVHALREHTQFFLLSGGITLAAGVGLFVTNHHDSLAIISSTVLTGFSIILLREANFEAAEAAATQEVIIENRILDLTYNLRYEI